MLSRHLSLATLIAVIALAPLPVAAADLSTYRDFKLGASTTDVIAQGRAAERDLTTVHERPALLQELSWRPPSTTSRAASERDSVAGIVFSFVDNQLFRMTVDYDRSVTDGLTRDDVIASLSAVYGPRSTQPTPATPRSALDSLDSPTQVARWREGDAMIVLNHSVYTGRFGLVITSVPLDAIATKAKAAAVALEAREAPAREAARDRARAEAAKAAAEKTRTTNKATFKP